MPFFFWWNQCLSERNTLLLTYQPINTETYTRDPLPKYEDITPNTNQSNVNLPQPHQNETETDQNLEQNSETIDLPPNYNSLERRNSI